jgi:hypothetical protein
MQTAEQNQEKNEILPSVEILERELAHDSEDRLELSQSKVEEVMKERVRMLEEIEDALSPRLAEALAIKIEHERESLKAMLDADLKTQEMYRSRNAVLPHDFFKKKLLNSNSL